MAHPDLTDAPAGNGTRPLPATIELNPKLGMSPNEMRAFRGLTGRSVAELEGQAEDQVQAGVWVALRRAGYDPTWEEAGDVIPIAVEDPADPTSSET